MKHVLILGSGITGLSAAYYLQKKSLEQGKAVRWTIIEEQDRTGGKVWTHEQDGFIMERGPDSFITQKPQAIQLCRDLGLEGQLLPCTAENQKVYVLKKGRLYAAPDGFRLAGPTQMLSLAFTPLFSLPGKIRMALEPFQKPKTGSEDESIADFVVRRFGKEALDTLAGPMMSGIFMGEADKLSMTASFPMMQMMEKKYGSIIKGFKAAAAKAPPGGPPPMFVSLKKGMQQLVDTLQAQLMGSWTQGRVEALAKSENGVKVTLENGDTLEGDAVILAVPAGEGARLLKDHDKELSDLLDGIPRVSSAGLNAAFKREQIGNPCVDSSFGFLVPIQENRSIRACTVSTSKFSDRGPEGTVLLRAFLGGTGRENRLEVDDDTLIKNTLDELRDLLQIKGDPLSQLLTRWPKANPQFAVGHPDRIKQIESRAADLEPYFIACNGIHGPGLPDRIGAAISQVERVLKGF